MDSDSLQNRIETILRQQDIEISDKILKILELGQEGLPENQAARLDREAIVFTALIEMLREEDNRETYLSEILAVSASLASVYAEQRNYRAIKPLAEEFLDIMRHGEASWEKMKEPVGEMIDILGDTAYNYLLLEMLILYLDAAAKEGKLKNELKGRVRKMLKLHLLLKEGCPSSYLLRRDLEPRIANLMSPEELLKIIISPEISSLKRDPVEYTHEWEDIYYDVEEELDRKFEGMPRYSGFCFGYWRAKKELLREKYGIEWRSPSQMNPRVKFD